MREGTGKDAAGGRATDAAMPSTLQRAGPSPLTSCWAASCRRQAVRDTEALPLQPHLIGCRGQRLDWGNTAIQLPVRSTTANWVCCSITSTIGHKYQVQLLGAGFLPAGNSFRDAATAMALPPGQQSCRQNRYIGGAEQVHGFAIGVRTRPGQQTSIHPVRSPGCTGAASQGVSPSNNLWSWNKRLIGWACSGPPCSRGRAADSWFRGQHQPLAFQSAGSGRTAAHLRHWFAGFGRNDQLTRLKDEPIAENAVHYGFDLWGQRVADFCRDVIDRPVRLVGNSIGGVVALRQHNYWARTARRGADRLRPARWTTNNWPQPADGLDPTVAENDGAATLAQHSTIPQCGVSWKIRSVWSRRTPVAPTSTTTWWICCFNKPNAKVPPKLSADSSACSTTISRRVNGGAVDPVDLIWGEQDYLEKSQKQEVGSGAG